MISQEDAASTAPPPRSEQKPVKGKREGGKKNNGEVKRKSERIKIT
jgi:hypothetical protein